MSFCFFVSLAMTFSEAETKVNKEMASIAAAQNFNALDPGVTSRSDKPPEERPTTAAGEGTSRPETSGGNVPAEAPKEKPKPENKPVKGSLRGANMPMITELGKMFMIYNIIKASSFKSFMDKYSRQNVFFAVCSFRDYLEISLLISSEFKPIN